MRPLFLSVRGFGPYVDLRIEEETFKKLSENKIFLISGEIGAGKTILFDAILYALYGDTSIGDSSRDKRSPQDLISHLIKDKKNFVPEVEFKFFLDGKVYRIKRRPSYEGRGKKVSLWIQEKFFSDKEQEVNHKIKELFKLEAKQFKKVFLIPQGEYRNILLSKPEDREELFKVIFDTYLFSEIEDFFKEKVKQLKQVLTSLTEREKNLQNLLAAPDLKEAEQRRKTDEKKLNQYKRKIHLLTQKKQEIELKIKIREETLETLRKLEEHKKTLCLLEEKLPDIKGKEEELKLLELLKNHYFLYELFVTLKKDLRITQGKLRDLFKKKKELTDRIENLKPALDEFQRKEPEIELLKLRLEKLKEIQKYLNEKKRLEAELVVLKDKILQNAEKQKGLKETIENLKKKLDSLNEKLYLCSKVQVLLMKKKEFDEVCKKKTKIETLTLERSELTEKIRELEDKIKKLESLRNELHLKNLALILAKSLESGKPCPVCGATIHPSPIKSENFNLQLKELEEKLQNYQGLLEELKKKLLITENMIHNLQLEIGSPDLQGILLELRDINEELDQILSKTGKEILNPSYGKFLEENLKQVKAQLYEKEREEEHTVYTLETLKAEFSQKQGNLERLNKLLNDSIIEERVSSDLSKYINERERQIADWEKRRKALQETLRIQTEEILKTEQDLKNTQNFKKELIFKYRDCALKLMPLVKRGVIPSLSVFENLKEGFSKIESLKAEINEFYTQKSSVERTLKELSLKLEELSEPEKSLELLEEELKNLKDEKIMIERELQLLNQEIGKINQRLEHLEKLIREYRELLQEKKAKEMEYELLAKISDLLSGKNSRGISFHAFVLSIFARIVFQAANLYLSHFSFGRYKFVEDLYLQKKGAIEVFDGYTGTKREVKTLSGGETFLATLALALGISDVLIYLFKTKPFESLFIDEGFGSLDEKTLERVVEILLSLSTKSGRIIGIISHLTELREVFPTILEVIKDPVSGSRVKLIDKNLGLLHD